MSREAAQPKPAALVLLRALGFTLTLTPIPGLRRRGQSNLALYGAKRLGAVSR